MGAAAAAIVLIGLIVLAVMSLGRNSKKSKANSHINRNKNNLPE